ncbi:MAG TPA: hypothetical protein VHA09_00195 [Nitrososphaera sp.]|nr:hypothetical protein [Nitrososphaera sp.]
MVSGKMGIGAILVALGVGGMAYAMPIESNSMVVDNNSPVIYNKVAPPSLPSSMVPYLGIVGASVASFGLGIALMAVGQTEVFGPKIKKTTSASPYAARKSDEAKEREETRQSSFNHAADAA